MFLVLAVATVVAHSRKRDVDSTAGENITREYLKANLSFYLGIALMTGFVWKWIGPEVPDPENFIDPLWTVIDVTQPLLMFTTGSHLMQSGD